MKNKVFIVTASSGIGAETIKLLMEAGANVFFSGIDEKQCLHLQCELKQSGYEASFLCGDLTHPETASNIASACISIYGRIDGLFNVAGISGRKYGDGPLHECTDEGWEFTIQANLTTQFRMNRGVITQMLKQDMDENGQRGVILNMASILGIYPEPKQFPTIAYGVSKGSIISMSKMMASYYAEHKIRVNALAPGLTLTPMSQRATGDKEVIALLKKKQPLTDGVMDGKDVAATAFYLLSNQSNLITGQVLLADAGWSVAG